MTESNEKTTKERLFVVVQIKPPGAQHWQDRLEAGTLACAFDKVARKALRLVRSQRPDWPRECSRAIRRTVTTVDEPMEL